MKKGKGVPPRKKVTATKGTIAGCACPWCHKPNDFRDVADYAVEPGNILECDYCHKKFQIQRVRQVTEIVLVPTNKQGNLRGG